MLILAVAGCVMGCGRSAPTSPAQNRPPVAGKIQILPASYGLAGLTQFSMVAVGGSDPDNDSIQYLWDLGDDTDQTGGKRHQ